MAENMAESSGLGAGTEAAIQPSLWTPSRTSYPLQFFPSPRRRHRRAGRHAHPLNRKRRRPQPVSSVLNPHML